MIRSPDKTVSGWRGALSSPLFCGGLLVLLALALRLYLLAAPVLRWDEGWSLAHASLPWRDLWRVATEEWHPPLYVALLKLWLWTGKSAWGLRYFSVLCGVLAVPLSYQVAKAWGGKTRLALLAAGFAALWPLLVYYGQVARMYALAALPVLLAAWFILRAEKGSRWGNDLGLALSAAAALYTLYHTAWALLALGLYALLSRSRSFARLLRAALIATVLFLPWLLSAQATLTSRLGGAGTGSGSTLLGALRFLPPAAEGFTFGYGLGWRAPLLVAGLLVMGLFCARLSRAEARRLLLPLLVVGITALGVAFGAQSSYWFAARHLVPATPFFGLGLAWALHRLLQRGRPLLPLAALALVVVYWPTSSAFVYQKTLEVLDPFDPAADHRYLAEHALPGDLVYFNALARAGWYENLRQSQNPRWSYALRWDPIIEPMERIAARLTRDMEREKRVWFALFKGSYGPNEPLKAWLDAQLYPAGGEWREDMLYLAYAVAGPDSASQQRAFSGEEARFVNGIRLRAARWDGTFRAGGQCAIELVWEAERPVTSSYKVFVHATDKTGRPLAQHDGVPASEARPTNGWAVGEPITDRHGLFFPMAARADLLLRVGLYDVQSGERLRLADGRDSIEVGTISWLER